MSFTFDRKSSFSVEGSRWRRLNPDGSYPAPDNQLGFEGTVDLSGLIATSKLAYREDAKGDFTELTIDLTGVGVDSTAATVAELVTALNADVGFTAVLTASADADTGRLKIVSAGTPDYLELSGEIASTLFFGGYQGAATGFGTHFIDCFNNQGAIGLPKEVKDFEELEIESGDGTNISMVVAALMKGLNPTLAFTDELYELKELIQGGSNDQSIDGIENRYTPPTTGQVYLPGFAGEVYEAKYEKGSNLRNNMVGYKRINMNNCNGIEADLNNEVKAWATYSYNVRVREYVKSGVKYPGYTEDALTLSQFLALGITVGGL